MTRHVYFSQKAKKMNTGFYRTDVNGKQIEPSIAIYRMEDGRLEEVTYASEQPPPLPTSTGPWDARYLGMGTFVETRLI